MPPNPSKQPIDAPGAHESSLLWRLHLLPDVYLLPIAEVVPLQLFAYFMAIERGVDVDRPRNLSKAVVEK